MLKPFAPAGRLEAFGLGDGAWALAASSKDGDESCDALAFSLADL